MEGGEVARAQRRRQLSWLNLGSARTPPLYALPHLLPFNALPFNACLFCDEATPLYTCSSGPPSLARDEMLESRTSRASVLPTAWLPSSC